MSQVFLPANNAADEAPDDTADGDAGGLGLNEVAEDAVAAALAKLRRLWATARAAGFEELLARAVAEHGAAAPLTPAAAFAASSAALADLDAAAARASNSARAALAETRASSLARDLVALCFELVRDAVHHRAMNNSCRRVLQMPAGAPALQRSPAPRAAAGAEAEDDDAASSPPKTTDRRRADQATPPPSI